MAFHIYIYIYVCVCVLAYPRVIVYYILELIKCFTKKLGSLSRSMGVYDSSTNGIIIKIKHCMTIGINSKLFGAMCLVNRKRSIGDPFRSTRWGIYWSFRTSPSICQVLTLLI